MNNERQAKLEALYQKQVLSEAMRAIVSLSGVLACSETFKCVTTEQVVSALHGFLRINNETAMDEASFSAAVLPQVTKR